jgi:creatinine amidohydrolase
MSYRWEEMTCPDFAEAVKTTGGVCIVPIGCLEKHGPHLPLGTDAFASLKIAELAVAQEPAVIFPAMFLGWIHDGKHHPGAVALPPDTLMSIYEGIGEECARNGLRKVIFLNGHGGNEPFLYYFSWKAMAKERSYMLYVLRLEDYIYSPDQEEIIPTGIGHAGEGETSMALAVRPELVRMEKAVPSQEAEGRLAHLPPVRTSFEWYADWSDHYQGDGSLGTAEKGEKLLAGMAEKVARVIKAVREDEVTPALQREFFGRVQH